VNSFLDGIGSHVGDFIAHPHLGSMTIAASHPHLAPVLVVPVLSCAVVPASVWAYKRRHHLRLSLRGLVSVKVWKERWRWHAKLSDVKIGAHPAPKSMAGWPTRSGAVLWLKMHEGMNMALLQKPEWSAAFASDLACMDLAFEREYRNHAQCLARIGRRDPLAETFPWPWMDRMTTDFFGPIPAGVDMDGKPVMIDLREHCMLVGGSTGAGKSWFLHSIVAAAMGDKRVRVHILDGKWGVGFDVWEPAANSFATNDKDDLENAYKILVRLEERVNKIYEALRAEGKRTIDWATAKHIDLLILDEFTAFLGYKDIHKRLMNLIARGRAAGLILILATQRPSSKIMDTDFRALFHYRVAFWSDKDGSKMILGDGIKADSSEFSGMNPGEMWLLAEAKRPVRCRGYSLTDDDLKRLAATARRLRGKDDSLLETIPADSRNDLVAPQTDSPPTVRSPKATSLSLVATDLPAEAHTEPVEPTEQIPAVPKALRPTLVLIALLGPLVSSKGIQGELGIPESTQRYRCQQLERLRLIQSVRDAKGNGGRDPLLWSTTQLGNAALRPREKEGANT
jgi:S-DNA-T family DNA segregation ATPase FtsK/SpoIIIE